MDDQTKNLIFATALSLLVVIGWSFLFPPKQPVPAPATTETAATGAEPAVSAAPAAGATEQAGAESATAPVDLKASPRIAIETPDLEGSIALTGGRIDDLKLRTYHETLDPASPVVTLLSPQGEPGGYQVLYGWAPGGDLQGTDVPDANTVWTAPQGAKLTPETPVTLTWTSPAGLSFARTIAVDNQYMFTVTQSVTNTGAAPRRLAPQGTIERLGLPAGLARIWVVHEGAILQGNDGREFPTYKDMTKLAEDDPWSVGGNLAESQTIDGHGWIGFTDHYWMTTMIPASDATFTGVVQYDQTRDVYRTISRLATLDVAPGQTQAVTTRLFAGAKRWETIRDYQDQGGVDNFIDTIDWGWFFYFTKPIFWLLHWLHGFIGNMGWSIMGLTLFLKMLLFPLAYKSSLSMARMKELQPEMEKLKARVGDDRAKLQQEMMALYKREKVNPAAGCLPILIQIPIFFSLYKVIFVTIELRQAPFIGWIRDLSAPDPSSLFNFFGLLPWAAPDHTSFLATIFIGLLPILLGISMWLQQKLNPAPADPTQQMIFAWMPWVFMFMLGKFASGLVLYWITNNTLTFIQQYVIMRSHGYKPDVFGNIKSGFRKKKSASK